MTYQQEKLQMIYWLIVNRPHFDRQVNAFYHYLQAHPSFLSLLEFSDQVIFAPLAFKISYQQTQESYFTYFKGDYSYQSIDQAFHDFRLNARSQKKIYYIELDCQDYYYYCQKMNIFVENPFAPLCGDLLKEVDYTADQLAKEGQRQVLMEHINQALIEHDRSKFDVLTNILRQAT